MTNRPVNACDESQALDQPDAHFSPELNKLNEDLVMILSTLSSLKAHEAQKRIQNMYGSLTDPTARDFIKQAADFLGLDLAQKVPGQLSCNAGPGQRPGSWAARQVPF